MQVRPSKHVNANLALSVREKYCLDLVRIVQVISIGDTSVPKKLAREMKI